MANIVLLPQIGISEESAVLTQWHVSKDSAVKAGDRLFTLETGKSSFEVESEFTGTVLALLANEGDEVLVKSPVCVIGQAGEAFSAETALNEPKDNREEIISEKPDDRTVTSPLTSYLMPNTSERETRSGVSPRARRLAEKNDIDPKLAIPTGPEGRVIERDIFALLEASEPVSKNIESLIIGRADAPTFIEGKPYREEPLSVIRRTIAKNMSASLQNTAQLTHTAGFDASDILAYRKILKETEGLSGITLTDMVLYAVTRTLPAHPVLNAWLIGDTIRYFRNVNLACAVDTERGLMVPVIIDASSMSLLEISSKLKALAEGCRNGTVAPELLSGGSFTVSNLGQYGIESFTPILNPPQTGILGVNAITTRVREEQGQLTPYPCMTLSLTYDHRAIDGAPASKFLQDLCRNLERFTALLAR
ncbi:MAG: 2-oxo acid dehydrogenase subunit E2 [Clostridiales bacterium]|nr:2-oxo acid dehydrogenase subunit E2 [Clostridiales bacterium]